MDEPTPKTNTPPTAQGAYTGHLNLSHACLNCGHSVASHNQLAANPELRGRCIYIPDCTCARYRYADQEHPTNVLPCTQCHHPAVRHALRLGPSDQPIYPCFYEGCACTDYGDIQYTQYTGWRHAEKPDQENTAHSKPEDPRAQECQNCGHMYASHVVSVIRANPDYCNMLGCGCARWLPEMPDKSPINPKVAEAVGRVVRTRRTVEIPFPYPVTELLGILYYIDSNQPDARVTAATIVEDSMGLPSHLQLEIE